MIKHDNQIKYIQRLADDEVKKEKTSSEEFIDRLKRQHLDLSNTLKDTIEQLDRDKKLQGVHLEQLNVEIDHYQTQL